MSRRNDDEEEITLSGLPFGLQMMFNVFIRSNSVGGSLPPPTYFYLTQSDGSKILLSQGGALQRNG